MTIILKFLKSDEPGYNVSIAQRIAEDFDGFLPKPTHEVESALENWAKIYRSLDEVRLVADFRIAAARVRVVSRDEQTEAIAAKLGTLSETFDSWLRCDDPRWQEIREELASLLRKERDSNEESRLLIDTCEYQLKRFPWHAWEFLNRYPDTEIALRLRGEGNREIAAPPRSDKVKILLVLGQDRGLDLTSDRQIIEQLQENGAEVTILEQPRREELGDALLSSYHIFVYAGHSRTDEDGTIGWLELSSQEKMLRIEEFKHLFKEAIDRGLQLAIFNSCDGIGLAHELGTLNLPRCIVMREPVPDRVATKFIKQFFTEFVENDKTFFKAVRIARAALNAMEYEYPGATALPIICTRESAVRESFTWNKLLQQTTQLPLLVASASQGDISQLLKQKSPSPKAVGSHQILLGSIAGSFILLLAIGAFIWNGISKPDEPIAVPSENPLEDTSVVPEVNPYATLKDVPFPEEIANQSFTYGGSTSFGKILDLIEPAIAKHVPDFDLKRGEIGGSNRGIEQLKQGILDFSLSSSPLREEDTAQLKQIAVAADALAIAVHPDLEIELITFEELQGIYRGEITNWNQIDPGLGDIPIRPFSRPDISGTTSFFKSKVLGDRDNSFGNPVKTTVERTTAALRKVAATEGGIYFATLTQIGKQCSVKPIAIEVEGEILLPYESNFGDRQRHSQAECEQVKALGFVPYDINHEYVTHENNPLKRELYIIVKTDGSPEAVAGEYFADLLRTLEGRQLIERAEYVGLD